jgi:GDP-L-fucose synthase
VTVPYRFDLKDTRVWVAGHTGMVGSALLRRLRREPVAEVLTVPSAELDLRRQAETERWVVNARPDLAIIAAAKVGGIQANRTAQGQFLYDNLMIAANAIEACRLARVEKVVVLGSSCIYPREAPQPMREEHLLTGPLEPTNEGYAIAKIAALELSKMYRRQYGMDVISLMPTNLYGPNDDFDLETAHVLPALLRKVHEARVAASDEVVVWGSGRPRREFLHVDDLADATIFTAQHYSGEQHLNIGTGQDISVAELAQLIARIAAWEGRLVFDPQMPDGAPRKLLDITRLTRLGWNPSIPLESGLRSTYRWFCSQVGHTHRACPKLPE